MRRGFAISGIEPLSTEKVETKIYTEEDSLDSCVGNELNSLFEEEVRWGHECVLS